MATLRLTRRALIDLKEIKKYSIEKHGTITAEKYLASIEDALVTIKEYPEILKDRPFAQYAKFYFVGKHTLVFAVLDNTIYVLTVKYGGMDIENIINRFEPTLMQEAEIMHKRLRKAVKVKAEINNI